MSRPRSVRCDTETVSLGHPFARLMGTKGLAEAESIFLPHLVSMTVILLEISADTLMLKELLGANNLDFFSNSVLRVLFGWVSFNLIEDSHIVYQKIKLLPVVSNYDLLTLIYALILKSDCCHFDDINKNSVTLSSLEMKFFIFQRNKSL